MVTERKMMGGKYAGAGSQGGNTFMRRQGMMNQTMGQNFLNMSHDSNRSNQSSLNRGGNNSMTARDRNGSLSNDTSGPFVNSNSSRKNRDGADHQFNNTFFPSVNQA